MACRLHWLGGGAAFEAALDGGVGLDIRLGYVRKAGIGIGRRNRAARQLVQVNLEGGNEALQIGLLVGRESDVTTLDEGQAFAATDRSQRLHRRL